MPANPKNNSGYNKLRGFLHLAVENYKWVKGVDTPFKFSQEDIDTLLLKKDGYGEFVEFCENHELINIDPSCRTLLNHFLDGNDSAAEEIEGSVFDYKPDLPRLYYINLICHFWSYLRNQELLREKREYTQ